MARILIVDDEDGIRKVLRQLLEYEGHEVRAAGGGGEALAVFEEFRPDLTFLDVKMARMDGLEVLDRLRAQDPDALVVMTNGVLSVTIPLSERAKPRKIEITSNAETADARQIESSAG